MDSQGCTAPYQPLTASADDGPKHSASAPSVAQQACGPSMPGPARNMTGSTVASESDLPIGSPWVAPKPGLEARLESVREQRGWKHFLRHTLRVPMAFAVGAGVGAGIAGAFMPARHAEDVFRPPPVQEFYATDPAPQQVPEDYMLSLPLNNSCLIPHLEPTRAGPQTFDACGFVIRSTDEVWNLRGNVEEAIEKYFHKDYYNAGSWGKRGVGKKELRDAVLAEMWAFPDIQIHITDCVCKGNDNDGYKCAMPDVLTGTNLGPSAYGPATGRYARWTGMVESIVKQDPETGQWQYVAEWGVHDEWALIQQLGLDFRRVPRPPANSEPLHDCTPLTVFKPDARMNIIDLSIQQARVAAGR